MSLLATALKSTIDKIGVDTAGAFGMTLGSTVGFAELDDATDVQKKFSEEKNCLIWELSSLQELPRDPLYSFSFNIGVRTFNDPGNYLSLKVLDALRDFLIVGKRIDLYDYSQTVAGSQKIGSAYVTTSAIGSQDYDRSSGVRMLTVSGRLQRSA